MINVKTHEPLFCLNSKWSIRVYSLPDGTFSSDEEEEEEEDEEDEEEEGIDRSLIKEAVCLTFNQFLLWNGNSHKYINNESSRRVTCVHAFPEINCAAALRKYVKHCFYDKQTLVNLTVNVQITCCR